MSYIGKTPTPAPLTSSDITDGIISTDKLADTSVTNAKINADIISAETELATAPADTDELLISDAGVLKRIDASLIGGGGITEADQWRITANFSGDVNPIASNLERPDQSGWGKIGTGMSHSSGVFTFPSTGIWKVELNVMSYYSGENRYTTAVIQATTNNSSYVDQANSDSGWSGNSVNVYGNSYTQTLIDVTDTSNVKVSFRVDVEDDATVTQGSTDTSRTYMMFTRLGDT